MASETEAQPQWEVIPESNPLPVVSSVPRQNRCHYKQGRHWNSCSFPEQTRPASSTHRKHQHLPCVRWKGGVKGQFQTLTNLFQRKKNSCSEISPCRNVKIKSNTKASLETLPGLQLQSLSPECYRCSISLWKSDHTHTICTWSPRFH